MTTNKPAHGEPWKTKHGAIWYGDGTPVGSAPREDAARIVACVNACAGVSLSEGADVGALVEGAARLKREMLSAYKHHETNMNKAEARGDITERNRYSSLSRFAFDVATDIEAFLAPFTPPEEGSV